MEKLEKFEASKDVLEVKKFTTKKIYNSRRRNKKRQKASVNSDSKDQTIIEVSSELIANNKFQKSPQESLKNCKAEKDNVSSLAPSSKVDDSKNNFEVDRYSPSSSGNYLANIFKNLQVSNSAGLVKLNSKKPEKDLTGAKVFQRSKKNNHKKGDQDQTNVIKKDILNSECIYALSNILQDFSNKSIAEIRQDLIQLVTREIKGHSEESISSEETECEQFIETKIYKRKIFDRVLHKTEQMVNCVNKDLRNHEKPGKFATKNIKSNKSENLDKLNARINNQKEKKVFLNTNFKDDVPTRKKHYNQEGSGSQNQLTPKRLTKAVLSSHESKMQDTLFPKYLTEAELEAVEQFGILLSGCIRINQRNVNEAYISSSDKGADIFIEGIVDRNRALEGDEVYYIIKNPEHFRVCKDRNEVQRTAIVVGIKNYNHNRCAIGKLQPPNKKVGSTFMVPRDTRIPKIRIKKSEWLAGFEDNPDAFKDSIFHVKIIKWDDVRYAEGEIMEEVGNTGDIEAETAAIMLMYNLDQRPHDETLDNFLPDIPYTISKSEISARMDMRKECIFTIDPATAKDLDDALGFKILPNGNFEISIHISDVSFFLPEGTPLDKAIQQRATTVYLVQKAYPMLPPKLCELCSLTPGEDKLAFSVIWELTPQYVIVSHRFTRSVINSCAKFSYDQVQNILEGVEDSSLPEIYGGHNVAEITEAIKSLDKIAKHFRKKRFSNGALRINQLKISFKLNEEGLPLSYAAYVNTDSHRLVEEYMLLANIAVAEEIDSCFPKIAFLRSHAPPNSHLLERLQKSLETHGVTLDISSAMSLHSSLLTYDGTDKESKAKMVVLNTLLAKPMSRAVYFCAGVRSDENKKHYALNVPLYTHFTSPIRRYADVIVHRLLAASLGLVKAPKWPTEDVQRIANYCNRQKYSAKLAGERSIEFYLKLYMLENSPIICEAVVCDVKDRSFECIVLDNGSHQKVFFENIRGRPVVKKQYGVLQVVVTWPKTEKQGETTQVIDIFSIVTIELKKTKEMKLKARLIQSRSET